MSPALENSENLQLFYLQNNKADFFNKYQYSSKSRVEILSQNSMYFNTCKNVLREEFILTDFSNTRRLNLPSKKSILKGFSLTFIIYLLLETDKDLALSSHCQSIVFSQIFSSLLLPLKAKLPGFVS